MNRSSGGGGGDMQEDTELDSGHIYTSVFSTARI